MRKIAQIQGIDVKRDQYRIVRGAIITVTFTDGRIEQAVMGQDNQDKFNNAQSCLCQALSGDGVLPEGWNRGADGALMPDAASSLISRGKPLAPEFASVVRSEFPKLFR